MPTQCCTTPSHLMPTQCCTTPSHLMPTQCCTTPSYHVHPMLYHPLTSHVHPMLYHSLTFHTHPMSYHSSSTPRLPDSFVSSTPTPQPIPGSVIIQSLRPAFHPSFLPHSSNVPPGFTNNPASLVDPISVVRPTLPSHQSPQHVHPEPPPPPQVTTVPRMKLP